jgi:hypothetical protein
MATYNLAHTISCTIKYTLSNGHSAYNVLHLGTTPTLDQGQVDLAASLVAVLWDNTGSVMTNGLKNSCTTDTTCVSVTGRSQDPADPLESVVAVNTTGTASVEAVPSESSVVTTFYTGVASRRGRGRMYLPGFSGNAVINGQVGSGDISQLEDVWDDWVGILAAEGSLEHVVWSPTDATSRTVTTYITRAQLHHQRRRNNR